VHVRPRRHQARARGAAVDIKFLAHSTQEMGMRERRVGGVVYHTSPAGARTGGMGHFARSQQPSAVKVRIVLV
jgi:hypothetical protein